MKSLICKLKLGLFLILALSLTACPFPPRIYRMDVRQGNYITPEMCQKLKVGMSKEAVIALMGSPALTHFFEPNRYDYYYSFKPGNGQPMEQKSVIVYFKNNQVVKIKRDL